VRSLFNNGFILLEDMDVLNYKMIYESLHYQTTESERDP